jgi:predicted secreted hydrolase
MRNSRLVSGLLLIFGVSTMSNQYRVALPGYHYQFPRDHFNHAEFLTEWWYYTGNVTARDGHRFGFELTFFRQGVDRESGAIGAWDLRDLYFAHLALSDLDGGQFLHTQRTNRAGPGIAGASLAEGAIWNGNCQITWHGEEQALAAIAERFQLHLTLRSEKPPVINGENGISKKAAGIGRASHYISLTRLVTAGKLTLDGKTFVVSGYSWMDHEFFTHQLDPEQVGWDWMSVQLEDKTELMLFIIRRKDQSVDPYSSGTYIDAGGHSRHLVEKDFALRPEGDNWRSPQTNAVYPVQWQVTVPGLGLQLKVTTPLKFQEFVSLTFLPAYWEGAISLCGTNKDQPIRGVGYLEMTGYDHPLEALR